jgi:hypothetical protein
MHRDEAGSLFLMSSLLLRFTLLPLIAPLHADIAWLDFQPGETGAAPLHRAVTGVAGIPVESGGPVFTLDGSPLGTRDRSLADPVLSDFVFTDGAGANIVLGIEGLAAGTYSVESFHYDGGGFGGAIQVESRPQANPEAATVVLANHAFATTAATYTFTTDGSAHELVFRENDGNDRVRLNGLKIRAAGMLAGPPGRFIDIDSSNTVAAAGTPAPFSTENVDDPGFTTGALWRRRPGFGFDVTSNREIYEKDANGGVGDAATLATQATGLVPGKSYGIHVAFLSVPTESWQVKGGLSATSLELFTRNAPAGRIVDLGLSSESGSNRRQFLGFVGNAVADESGALEMFADDGDGTATNWSTRSWLEGFLVGDAVVVPPLPGNAIEIAPDGAWTWFNDERSILHQGSLFSGYVKGNGTYGVTRHDLTSGENFHMVISTASSQQQDDHNNPSITVLPDGKLMLLYSKHIGGSQFYQRTSLVTLPSTNADWGPEIVRPTPAANTYANTYRLSGESDALYNFHRCINFNPTLTISTDNGATWGASRQFLGTGSGSTRPYPRYTSNGTDRIDLIYTDGHPRDVENSVYHLYYRNGELRKTDGTLIDTLANIPLDHDGGEKGNVIYPFSNAAWGPGDGPDDWIPTGRGWTWDVHYGSGSAPVCVFQVQKDNVTGTGWNHDRIYYYYARWTGTEWQRRFIAQAGRPLYSAEDDYGGGMCLDPEDPRVVYISTNAADPFALGDIDAVPLRANERYEIYRGFTSDGGLTFTWTPVTESSTADNLRPIVPPGHGHSEFLVWFHGTYSSYTNFSAKVLARIGLPQVSFQQWSEEFGLPGTTPLDSDQDGIDDLLEYAFDGDPEDPGSRSLPDWEGNAFTFPWPEDRSGIEWRVEESDTLANWSTVAVFRTRDLPREAASGFEADFTAGPDRRARVVFTGGTSPARRFLRVRIVNTD